MGMDILLTIILILLLILILLIIILILILRTNILIPRIIPRISPINNLRIISINVIINTIIMCSWYEEDRLLLRVRLLRVEHHPGLHPSLPITITITITMKKRMMRM
jgi:hypothetical protein